MTLTLREAQSEDLPAIVVLLAEDTIPVDREDPRLPLDPRYLAAFDAIQADPNNLLAVAEHEGRVVGTLQITFIPGLSFRGLSRGLIESVRIASDMRGRRFGEQMMAWAVEQCRARGCRLAQLTSTSSRLDAHRFYERLGWQKTHTGFKLPIAQEENAR
jgi:GNAT superfamily N-acetyltransferase